MKLILNEKNILTSVGTPLPSRSSLRSYLQIELPKHILNNDIQDCDFMLVIATRQEFNAAKLECSELDNSIYNITKEDDFSLDEGHYSTYIIVYDPNARTHISSNVTHLIVGSSNESLMTPCFYNLVDSYFDLKQIERKVQNYYEQIKKLTELNLQLHKDINKENE